MSKEVRIYNRIKSALAEKRKTSKWLAEHLGFSLNSVSRWCRNLSQPEIENLYKVAEALGIEARDLLVVMKESVLTEESNPKEAVLPKKRAKGNVSKKLDGK